MPAAIAIPAAISAGSSIFSGILGSRAAKKAGQMQSDEAQRQAQLFRDVLGQYNPQIGLAAERGGQMAVDAAGQLRTDALSANELLNPYIGAGTESLASLREFMAPGGAGNRTFTAADMEAYDPGYAFRIAEAQKALQTSAAARGGALGGGTLKALNQRVQDVASSEFGAAHERFRQQQQDRYNRLFGVTQLGGQYAGQAGQNLLTAGAAGQRAAEFAGDLGFRGAGMMAENAFGTQRSIADLMTGGAAARAAGTVGSANAWGQGLAGVGNAAMQVGNYYQDKDLLEQYQQGQVQNRALKPWTPPPAPDPTVVNLPGTPPLAAWRSPNYEMPWYLRGTDYGYSARR